MSGDVGKWDFLHWRWCVFWGMDSMDGWQRLWYMGVQQRIINQQKWDWTHQKVLIQSSKVGMLQNHPRKTISKRWTSGFARFTTGYLRISLPFCSSFFMIKIPNIYIYIGYINYNNRNKNPARVSNTAHCLLVQKQGWSGSINPGERYGSKRCPENS